jgi:molecular chaperone HscB
MALRSSNATSIPAAAAFSTHITARRRRQPDACQRGTRIAAVVGTVGRATEGRRLFTNPAPAGSAQESPGETDAATGHGTPVRGPSAPPFYALFPKTLPRGPPPAGPFDIDARALRREFLRLQAAAHPDFHHAAGGGQQARAGAASALINEAYRTLRDPLLRAEYLLRVSFGVDLAGDEAGRLTTADPDVLAAVLDAREAIEDAADEEALQPLRAENEARIRDAERALAEAFAADDCEAAKGEAVKLRYWVNVRQGLDNWESGKPVVLQH